jgi:hypothetical protein
MACEMSKTMLQRTRRDVTMTSQGVRQRFLLVYLGQTIKEKNTNKENLLLLNAF